MSSVAFIISFGRFRALTTLWQKDSIKGLNPLLNVRKLLGEVEDVIYKLRNRIELVQNIIDFQRDVRDRTSVRFGADGGRLRLKLLRERCELLAQRAQTLREHVNNVVVEVERSFSSLGERDDPILQLRGVEGEVFKVFDLLLSTLNRVLDIEKELKEPRFLLEE